MNGFILTNEDELNIEDTLEKFSFKDLMDLYDYFGNLKSRKRRGVIRDTEWKIDYMNLDRQAVEKAEKYLKEKADYVLLTPWVSWFSNLWGFGKESLNTISFLMAYTALLGIISWSGLFQYPKELLRFVLDLLRQLLVVTYSSLLSKTLEWFDSLLIILKNLLSYITNSIIILIKKCFNSREKIFNSLKRAVIYLFDSFKCFCKRLVILSMRISFWIDWIRRMAKYILSKTFKRKLKSKINSLNKNIKAVTDDIKNEKGKNIFDPFNENVNYLLLMIYSVKKKRENLDTLTRMQLELYYKQNSKPDLIERKELSNFLKIDCSKITKWFENKRFREKQS